MTISRPDVRSDAIVEFPIETRLIKLPIQNYLKLSGDDKTINAPQIALVNAINDPKYRFVCAALARRLGKTYIANIIAHLVSLMPGVEILIMSPNYSLSTISFELQRKLINRFGIEITRDNLKERILELSNGSTVRMGSVGQVDSCVGRSYRVILFDESALHPGGEDAFNIALRPTLDQPGSKAIFISTPRGKKNWFSRFFARGFSDEYPEWVSIQADYKENSRMNESDVREARISMSKAEFEQEYMASFNTFEGAIYNLEAESVIDYYPVQDECVECFAGLDPGYRDSTGFVVVKYVPHEDCFYVVDEYLQKEVTTDVHAAEIKRLSDKHNIELIFIDSAAAQTAADLAYVYDIATTKAKKDVLAGIAYVQALIEKGQLKVHQNCTNMLDALDQYQWSTNENLIKDKPEHNFASHMCDALRYALYTFKL